MMKILALGECMVELNHSDEQSFNYSFAGDTFNTAYYLAHLSQDAQVSYGTTVSNCHLSQQFIKTLPSWYINHSCVNTVSTHPMGLYRIETDEDGERTFIYYRSNSAATQFVQKLLSNDLNYLYQQDILYLSGITFAILTPNDQQQLLDVLKQYKRQSNGQIFFDNNYRARLWQNHLAAQSIYDEVHQYCDVIFTTYSDEQPLYQDDNIQQTIERYYNTCSSIVIIKNGPNSVISLVDKQITETPPPAVSNVIDTTAAGDSFNAGFINAYSVHQQSLIAAVQAGSQLASTVIQHPGAIIKPSIFHT